MNLFKYANLILTCTALTVGLKAMQDPGNNQPPLHSQYNPQAHTQLCSNCHTYQACPGANYCSQQCLNAHSRIATTPQTMAPDSQFGPIPVTMVPQAAPTYTQQQIAPTITQQTQFCINCKRYPRFGNQLICSQQCLQERRQNYDPICVVCKHEPSFRTTAYCSQECYNISRGTINGLPQYPPLPSHITIGELPLTHPHSTNPIPTVAQYAPSIPTQALGLATFQAFGQPLLQGQTPQITPTYTQQQFAPTITPQSTSCFNCKRYPRCGDHPVCSQQCLQERNANGYPTCIVCHQEPSYRTTAYCSRQCYHALNHRATTGPLPSYPPLSVPLAELPAQPSCFIPFAPATTFTPATSLIPTANQFAPIVPTSTTTQIPAALPVPTVTPTPSQPNIPLCINCNARHRHPDFPNSKYCSKGCKDTYKKK